MGKERIFDLEAVRTDGWFERIGEGIGSFQALCEIVGEAFFAFSMITGARITALTVDRRNPDNTLVDFVVGGSSDEEASGEAQRLPLGEFRHRLVAALVTEEPHGPVPTRDDDIEGAQQHIGVRYLLVAPLYGYSLRQLVVQGTTSHVVLTHDGEEEVVELEALRAQLREHVRSELERSSGGQRSAIDLTKVGEAELAAEKRDFTKVYALLSTWPAPLAVFLRTPEGQALAPEARSLIAKGLGLLGTACVELDEAQQGEEILRLGIQYAQESPVAGDLFRRLGEAMMATQRHAEAIGALRRGLSLAGPPRHIWPMLARCYLKRERYLAALSAIREARSSGASEQQLATELATIEEKLGSALTRWRGLVAQARS